MVVLYVMNDFWLSRCHLLRLLLVVLEVGEEAVVVGVLLRARLGLGRFFESFLIF